MGRKYSLINFASGIKNKSIEIRLISEGNSGMHLVLLFFVEEFKMHAAIIEEIVVREFKGLCTTCLHASTCSYLKKQPDKIVIQCELFEVDNEVVLHHQAAAGLCRTCDLASDCKLPGRRMGTWHCNEFI